MNWRIRKLLGFLADGKWHREVLLGGVGIGTVELCIDQGLVATKRYNVRRRPDGLENFCVALRITPLGRKVLLGKSGR